MVREAARERQVEAGRHAGGAAHSLWECEKVTSFEDPGSTWIGVGNKQHPKS